MLWIILQAVYYFVPAYFANCSPVVFSFLNPFPEPIDFGRSFRGKRIFGDNKTIGGILIACLVGILSFFLQRWLYGFEFFKSLSIIDYTKTSWILGLLFGFGAIIGDAIKSFFKRRIGIASGKDWFFFDQTDFVAGGLLFSFLIYIPDIYVIAVVVLLSPIIHVIANVFRRILKL